MVQSNQFCGKAHEDASAHLQPFLEIYSTFTIKGVTRDAILFCLFSFSLLEKAKQRFYVNKDRYTTWDNCSTAFPAKFFPMGKTNAFRGKITSFQQQYDESVPEACKLLKGRQRPHLRRTNTETRDTHLAKTTTHTPLLRDLRSAPSLESLLPLLRALRCKATRAAVEFTKRRAIILRTSIHPCVHFARHPGLDEQIQIHLSLCLDPCF
jgi:hypothetical protein